MPTSLYLKQHNLSVYAKLYIYMRENIVSLIEHQIYPWIVRLNEPPKISTCDFPNNSFQSTSINTIK